MSLAPCPPFHMDYCFDKFVAVPSGLYLFQVVSLSLAHKTSLNSICLNLYHHHFLLFMVLHLSRCSDYILFDLWYHQE